MAFYASGQTHTGSYVPRLEFPNYPAAPDNSSLIRALEMGKAERAKNDQIKKEKAQASIAQIKSYYASVTAFPSNISNGWHMVFTTNNYDFCDERKVFVENGKITKYFIEDWIEKKISFSTMINDAKAMIQLFNSDGIKGDMLDVYFLDNINNVNAYTAPPVGSGKISFWTDDKRAGNISLYIDDSYIGMLTSYFKETTPNCGQTGTVVFEYKPGTYNYYATNGRATWKGSVTIYAGDCRRQGLTK